MKGSAARSVRVGSDAYADGVRRVRVVFATLVFAETRETESRANAACGFVLKTRAVS